MGEAGLATTAGAELIPLDTTEDAGTWRARRSAPGLVGSSVGEGRRARQGRPGGKAGEERRGRRQVLEKGQKREDGKVKAVRKAEAEEPRRFLKGKGTA